MQSGRWGILCSKSNHERVVEHRVRSAGFGVYRPLVRFETTSRRGEKRIRVLPLFERYIMFRFSKNQHWPGILSIRGVTGILLDGEQPRQMSPVEVQRLRDREDADGFVVLAPPIKRFSQGDRVRATRGSFQNVDFGIYDVSSAADRARVMFDMLGVQVAVELDEADLESVAA